MASLPYYAVYPGDFFARFATWTGEERGLFMILRMIQWSAGPLPTDPKRIAKVAGYEYRTFARCWPVISAEFVETESGLVNPDLEKEREAATIKVAKKSLSGKLGADARWRDGERHATANDETTAVAMRTPMAKACPPVQSNSVQSNSVQSNSSQTTEGESERRSPATQQNGHSKRSRKMPADFDAESLRGWAAINTPEVDFDRELAKLRDYEYPTPKADWNGATRNWLRKAQEMPRANGHVVAPVRRMTAEEAEQMERQRGEIP